MRAPCSRIAAEAILVLVCQIVPLGGRLAGNFQGAAPYARAATECTCETSGHQNAMCPMHHTAAAKTNAGAGSS